ncbi:MAG TPA: hypothetical protein VMW35_12900 [Myxococcota bacterium]|nr:hypothetical protein [Myxococcota bacterium]
MSRPGGKQRYQTGTGFLICDGGTDGGFWLGMCKAWQLSAVARLPPSRWRRP